MIISEISKPQYLVMTDAEVAMSLSEPVITVTKTFFANERTLYAELGPAIAETILQKLSEAGKTNNIIARAYSWFSPAAAGIDLGHSGTRAMLDDLESSNILTSEETTLLKALGEKKVSWFEANNIPVLHEGDIKSIRSKM